MKQNYLRLLIILPFMVIGPSVAVYLIWQGKNYSSDALLPAFGLAGGLIAITTITAFIVRKMNPVNFGKRSITIAWSYIITMVIVAIFALRDAFFIVVIIFVSIYASLIILPFAFFWTELFHLSGGNETNNAQSKSK